MTDIEIIRAMEKILQVPLPRLEPGYIEKYFRYIKRGYSLDSTGAVAGLRLEYLFWVGDRQGMRNFAWHECHKIRGVIRI